MVKSSLFLKKIEIPRHVIRPCRYVIPVLSTEASSSRKFDLPPVEEVHFSEPQLSSTELYIPESKPSLAINKMHHIYHTQYPLVDEWQYANHRFVKCGKWPPKTKLCTTSFMS